MGYWLLGPDSLLQSSSVLRVLRDQPQLGVPAPEEAKKYREEQSKWEAWTLEETGRGGDSMGPTEEGTLSLKDRAARSEAPTSYLGQSLWFLLGSTLEVLYTILRFRCPFPRGMFILFCRSARKRSKLRR